MELSKEQLIHKYNLTLELWEDMTKQQLIKWINWFKKCS